MAKPKRRKRSPRSPRLRARDSESSTERNPNARHPLKEGTMDVRTFTIPAAARFRRHAHEAVHLCAVLEGRLAERDGKGSVELGTGDLRLSPACRHDIDFGPMGAHCLLIQLEPEEVEPLGRSLFVAGQPRLCSLVRALGRVHAERDRGDATLRQLRVEAAATELVAQLERLRDGRPLPPPPWLERVRERLHDVAETPSVAELARLAGVHRVHLWPGRFATTSESASRPMPGGSVLNAPCDCYGWAICRWRRWPPTPATPTRAT